LIGCDLAAYPNVRRWFEMMKRQPGWAKCNEAFYGWRDSLKGKEFARL
jgi:glutathione S-transferase